MMRMTIMRSSAISSIPWSAIQGHAVQAKTNHGQTLERLNERGGLGVCEAVAIIEDRRWHRMEKEAAEARLKELVMPHLIAEAHRRIKAELPEDEPDCVPDWVCELLIKLGQENAGRG